MKRSTRALIAKDTLSILKKGSYQNNLGKPVYLSKALKTAKQQTVLYEPKQLLELIQQPLPIAQHLETEFVVNSLTTLDAVRKEYPTDQRLACLNFASAKNPGGGFLNGSQAQEESIARASGLYPCQLKAEHYYKENRTVNSCLYTDHIIYSPNVPIFKDENGNLLDELTYSAIITAPAVNAGAVQRNEPNNVNRIHETMQRRMDMVLAICKQNGHETLILGAWGCGVFQNDPVVIAALFKELLLGKYKNQFKRVVFAIYAKEEHFIKPFEAEFGK
ncbi:TIGR02452 family protein [Aureispira sp. CCB-QB1]|uniref:TIGR02452 family protein n=1 Tax=Aureispira sp. CCB-QB1 TaxID=1313421 RepID=UPI000696D07E|nr:TIGR02452 family protein [Aureispira sp. CCB-QB1]